MTAHFGMKVITDLLQFFSDSSGVRFQMTVAVRSFRNEEPFSNDSHWAKAALSFRNDGHRTVISEGKSDLLWICRGFIRPPLVSE